MLDTCRAWVLQILFWSVVYRSQPMRMSCLEANECSKFILGIIDPDSLFYSLIFHGIQNNDEYTKFIYLFMYIPDIQLILHILIYSYSMMMTFLYFNVHFLVSPASCRTCIVRWTRRRPRCPRPGMLGRDDQSRSSTLRSYPLVN